MKKYLTILSVLWWGCCGNVRGAAAEFENPFARPDIHGFLSQGFLQSTENNYFAKTTDGTFQFNEFGLSVASDLTDRLSAGIQLFSRDIGEIGNNAIELDWAFGDYRWKDWFGIRAGKLKVPQGFYNDTRDLDLARTWIFLPPSIYSEGERNFQTSMYGLNLYGLVETPRGGSVLYQFQIGEKDIGEFSEPLVDEAGAPVATISINISKFYTACLEWQTPLEGFRLQGFYTSANFQSRIRLNDDPRWEELGLEPNSVVVSDDQKFEISVLSAEYVYHDLSLTFEYQWSPLNDMIGYYGSLSYRVTDWCEAGVYYSVAETPQTDNPEDSSGNATLAYADWQKEFVTAMRFDINDSWLIKIEGHAIHGVGQMQASENADGLQEDSFLVALKTTFNF